MDRRQVLRMLTSATLLPALSPDAFSLFRTVHAQIAASGGLKTLNPDQNATVTAMAELILPRTTTAGATDVKVNEFVDLILTEWCEPAETARFLAGLSDVDDRSAKLFGRKFSACTKEQQTQIMKVLDDDEPHPVNTGYLFSANNATSLPPLSFFYTLKLLTLIGYYTSEAGFEDELHNSIIPPSHSGCAPLPAEGTV